MDDEIYLSDLLAQLLGKWRLLLVFTVIGAAAGLVVAWKSAKLYESTATIFVQQSSSLAGLTSTLPLALGTSPGSTGYYTTLLKSNTLLGNAISRLSLTKDSHFAQNKKMGLRQAVRKLKRMVLVKEDKSGGVEIRVKSADPMLSARIANGLLDSLSQMVATSSRRKARFIERRLAETTEALEDAEAKLVAFQRRVGVPAVEEEAKRIMEQLGELDLQVLSAQVELLETKSALDNSGDLDLLVQQEIRRRGLESGLDYLLKKREEAIAALNRLPDIAATYLRLQRDVTVLSKTFELLTERYQIARIEQEGEGGQYQVIDRAVPSDVPVGPGTMAKASVGGFAGLVTASILVLTVGLTRKRRKG